MMKIERYKNQQTQLPQDGKHIVAQSDENSIIVYQAFHPSIANYAVQHQKFGGSNYSFNRMTWIKPNFMWMMYRSGWGTKVNQERTLAIRLKKEGFDTILEQAVHSSFQAHLYETQDDWKKALKSTDVRLQWDPDHSPTGDKLTRRAIQLGIKNQLLQTMNEDWIIEIEDLTTFVAEQRKNTRSAALMVPFERVVNYAAHQKIVDNLGLTTT